MLKNFLKFSLGAVAIIAFGVALYFAASYYKEWKDKNSATQQQKPDEIIITELPNGEKLVENKTEGFSVKVANTWQVEKPTSVQVPTSFYTDNLVCKITSSTEKLVSNFNELENKLKNEHLEWYTINQDQFLITEINGKKVLKNILDTVEGEYSISIYLLKDKLYTFSVMNNRKDKELCSKQFDKFLETISIK